MILFQQQSPLQPQSTIPDTAWGMPPQVSTFAESIDNLYILCFWVSVFFFAIITGVLVFSLIKWRRKTEDQPAASNETHNTALEVTWTVIPLIIVMVIFAWGWRGSLDMTMAPPDALTYQVRAQKWSWSIKHPNHTEPLSNEIWVPLGRPVKFVMSSADVLHSFFLPAMRVKRDVLPGRYQIVWFEATHTGTFPLFCTEYCGDNHSKMIGEIHVVEADEFEAGLREKRYQPQIDPNAPADVQGKGYFAAKGCASCHSVDGSKLVGPTFKGLFGKEEELVDGSKVRVDQAYLVESILTPNAKVVKGFVLGQMPPQTVTEDEAKKIAAYIETLK